MSTPATCELGHQVPPRPPGPFTDDQCRRCWQLAKPDTKAISSRSLPCVHQWDGILEACPRGDESLHVRGCDLHDKCTNQKCRACPDYSAVHHLEVQTDGRGIGDAVSQLYACCGLADASGFPVVMRARHALGWFAGVSHPGVTILPHNGEGTECNSDYPGQCRAANSGEVSSRCQWYCDRLSDAYGIPRFAPVRPKTVAKPTPVRDAGYVIISAFSDHAERSWPVHRWRELAWEFHTRGKVVIAIDKPGDGRRLLDSFGSMPGWMRWHYGESPEWTAALIANADHFIGNDSGMAHIAGLYGTPGAVVMTMFPFPFVFDLTPSLVGVGRHGQSLADISVGEVVEKIVKPVAEIELPAYDTAFADRKPSTIAS